MTGSFTREALNMLTDDTDCTIEELLDEMMELLYEPVVPEKVRIYRCERRLKRNLPYQRRIY